MPFPPVIGAHQAIVGITGELVGTITETMFLPLVPPPGHIAPDSVENTMGLMTQMRIRHLPVIEDGRLLGLVSIGDVVKMQHDRLTMENHYLKSYLQG